MQSSFRDCQAYPVITLTCNQSSAFNRRLLSLIRQWDRTGRVRILSDNHGQSETISPSSSNGELCVSDETGERWYGAEAVPIIFKSLPFGKIAAAMYILPGTMWVTKQIYALEKPSKSTIATPEHRWH
jgi:predicted DCC family thiol-disulfide oxidoreductase YuxK